MFYNPIFFSNSSLLIGPRLSCSASSINLSIATGNFFLVFSNSSISSCPLYPWSVRSFKISSSNSSSKNLSKSSFDFISKTGAFLDSSLISFSSFYLSVNFELSLTRLFELIIITSFCCSQWQN